MLSISRSSESGSYRGRIRRFCASIILALMFFSPVIAIAPRTSSDPGSVDNGDYTRSVLWNFTDSSGYSFYNTTVSDGLGGLELINDTVVENSTAQYLLGTSANVDLQTVQDAIVIDNTSLLLHTLTLQPGPEGKDNYMDEWFPSWSPPEGNDLELDCNYDPGAAMNRRSTVIMEFNLSLIPAGATIKQATLNLYEKSGKAPVISYTIRAVTKTWAEAGVSWTMRDSVRYWDQLGGDYSADVFGSGTIDGTNGWKSFDLTRLVDLWTRGTIPNNGFVIVATPANLDGLKTFTDCETVSKPDQRPKVTVSYALEGTSGTYESLPLGPGANTTFTLASWGDGIVSKASDEFDAGNISSKWMWTNNPSISGGSVNFDRSGWLNITGSPSTTLANETVGCNYLRQNITGNFEASTSLQTFFSASSMGAGILVTSGSMCWLAMYLTGVEGSNSVIAQAFNGSATSTLCSVPWAGSSAQLRMDRTNGFYQLLTSSNGVSWNLAATYSPAYDFAQTASVGILVFSGGAPANPVTEFDFIRIGPMGQSPTTEMRIRTGNSTSLADPSWGAWGAPVSPKDGIVLNTTGMYLQYQVTLWTSCEWSSSMFSGFTSHDEHYLPNGTIVTENVYPVDLDTWETMTVNETISDGWIDYYYSSDLGMSWVSLGAGTSFSLMEANPSMMVRMELRTFDTITSPTIDTIELLYNVSIIAFHVTTTASATAGADFPMTIEAIDPSGNLATGWNGTVTLEAMDSSGTLPASGVLTITSATIPLGGTVTIWSQRYESAETIRISATAGAVQGLSAPVTVHAGPIASLTLDPGNTTMHEFTSEAFTANAFDAFGNVITDEPITWTVEPSLGYLNSTVGATVLLTVGDRYTAGYLNVSCSGMTVSRWIEVLPVRFAPVFTSPLPDQVRSEDAPDWTLDISGNVSDTEDPLSKLCWYAANESIVEVHGENRTGNLVITFSTLPDVFGTSDVHVYVVDSDGMRSMTTLRVVILPVNDPPRIDLIDPLTVRYDTDYVYDFTHYVHDPDNSYNELSLSVDIANLPYTRVHGMMITFTYPKAMEGMTRSVIVTVTDPDGGYSATAVLIRISENQVPVQSRILPIVELDEGSTREDCAFLPDYFHDPDEDALTFEALCDHSTLTVNQDDELTVAAPDNWYGTEYAIIRATDPSGARAEGVMQIDVRHVNHPPEMSGVPDLKVHYDLPYEFDLSPYISDPEMESEDIVLTSSDLHCTFNGLVMSVLYPASMNDTVNTVTITVSDGTYSSSCQVKITVSANYPPTLLPGIPLPDHSFLEDVPSQYPVVGGLEDYFWDNEDGNVLRFVVFSSTSNVTATAVADGMDSWTVEFNTTQDYNGVSGLVIRAIDSQGAIAEKSIALDVVPVPDAPRLSFPVGVTVTEGEQTIMSLGQYITDPDSSFEDDDFSFEITTPDSDAGTYTQYIKVLPSIFVFGFPDDFVGHGKTKTFKIDIRVTDQDGKVSSCAMSVTVEKAPTTKDDSLLKIGMLLSGAVAFGFLAVAVRMRKKPFVIKDMMLIHNDGFLIGRYAGHSHVDGEIDQDILSGMLTAVLNFVEDSMVTNQDELKTFGFKEFQVLVKRGAKSFAAIVFEGDLPDTVDKPLTDFLATFERVYKKKITAWTGDIDTDFAGVELLIQSFVKEHSKHARGKAKKLWVSKTVENGGAPAK
jgi:hypothetical protein